MTAPSSAERIQQRYEAVRDALLGERNREGFWTGELSTSPLSTATAIVALEMVRRARDEVDPDRHTACSPDIDFRSLIAGGLKWIAEHQNPDGGWGDTTKSVSNISTTMLAHAAFHAASGVRRTVAAIGAPGAAHASGADESQSGDESPHSKAAAASVYANALEKSRQYIERVGGVEAVVRRYGKDKTFSIPILTHCALAGLIDWREVQPLPFELACLPARFYKAVRLPVVSYALPALIAIGQVRHHHRKPWNPLLRLVRNLARRPSLRVLERIQPSNGGFLEATPLTSFVTMSLAGMGLADHPVVRKGIEFLVGSVRPDGSWPIDTNLATWVTTLSVNALGDDLPEDAREPILRWLLDQQYKTIHPYTNAPPGGWAWTDLPGGVPDGDDTPGAVLAILTLLGPSNAPLNDPDRPRGGCPLPPHGRPRFGLPATLVSEAEAAVRAGSRWLLNLRNRDGGWPTFCRGWGRLPFDRSAPDLTAHVIRALWGAFRAYVPRDPDAFPSARGIVLGGGYSGDWITALCIPMELRFRVPGSVPRGLRFLRKAQRADGSWLPLWFGNQYAPEDINPTYGTARVLAAFRDCGLTDSEPAQRGHAWLRQNQNPDGGWGAGPGTPSSVEETALAVEILLSDPDSRSHALRGLNWLMDRIEDGSICEPSPIGFYFARLWYFERLYPLIFTVAALRRARRLFGEESRFAATEGSAPSGRG